MDVEEVKKYWHLLFDIFCSFLKLGPLTFGGGYAMIPLIEREVVMKRKWLKAEDLADVFAVAQSIPGAIAINAATMVGYRLAGMAGAIAAMTGILFPTFLIVLLLCMSFIYLQGTEKFSAAMEGIRAATVALIAYAGILFGRKAILDKTTLVTTGVTVGLLLLFNLNPVIVIILGAVVGILLVRIKEAFGIVTKLEKQPVDGTGEK